MVQINRLKDVLMSDNPLEAREAVKTIAAILDENYGADRDPKADLGGYILLIETPVDLEHLYDYLDWKGTIPEYVERISCYIGGDYSLAHFQLSSDYSITVFMPMGLLPEQLKKYLEE